ncbi:MAG: peptidoglycan DD-metalloendopeptidase family protein, partial [Proteobacteria bacterium]|nr:peptidoglycan DD-metalloendopeptidase family protein [Pseudomonadota bacterium]
GIEESNRALAEHRAALKKINRRLSKARRNLKKTDKKIARLDKKKEKYKGALASRLVAIYKMRSGKAMPLLFASFSTPEDGRRYQYLSTVMGSDRELIGKAERNIKELGTERAKLASIQKDIIGTRKKARRRKEQATRARRSKKKLLNSVRRKKDRHKSMLRELVSAEADLLKVLEGLGGAGFIADTSDFARMVGKLPMPVEGRVVSTFGKKKHPRFKTVTFNNGIVIKAELGTEVRSVYSGRVVYVGWLKGYGQVLIMDNGGGYYTLFAYLSEILKKKGTSVVKGEIIALVGDSGPKDTTGLYFELRRKGVPKDPMEWLAKR